MKEALDDAQPDDPHDSCFDNWLSEWFSYAYEIQSTDPEELACSVRYKGKGGPNGKGKRKGSSRSRSPARHKGSRSQSPGKGSKGPGFYNQLRGVTRSKGKGKDGKACSVEEDTGPDVGLPEFDAESPYWPDKMIFDVEWDCWVHDVLGNVVAAAMKRKKGKGKGEPKPYSGKVPLGDCRKFAEEGSCSRGDSCKYRHMRNGVDIRKRPGGKAGAVDEGEKPTDAPPGFTRYYVDAPDYADQDKVAAATQALSQRFAVRAQQGLKTSQAAPRRTEQQPLP